MTPSNNPNGEPLIYRFCDAAGVFHLVAPVNHTHTYADIPGLADDLSELWAGVNEKASQEDMTEALAGKQNVLTFDSAPTAGSTNPVTSGGVKVALDEKAPLEHTHNKIVGGSGSEVEVLSNGNLKIAVAGGKVIGLIIGGSSVEITGSNQQYLYRLLQGIDSTPTDNSDKLVTSGGVAAALAEKADTSAMTTALAGKAPLSDTQVQVFQLEIDPSTGSLAHMIMVDSLFQNGNTQATIIIDNKTGETLAIEDAFYTTTQDDLAFMGENAIAPNIPTESIVACRILKRATPHSDLGAHYYIIIDGVIAF